MILGCNVKYLQWSDMCVFLCVCVYVFYSIHLQGSWSSLEGARPVGQVDKHILLLVHGVGSAGKIGI